ncbi:hypothetical protein [Nocardia sp. NPDC051981]|uniref:hypothetical protein n=1 Tax=Nocardia sp. NPDC051981 TaxID=3155417 RepID=UPI0034268F50
MRSLEEEFAALTDRVKHLDHETLAVQRDELRKERALLDQARLAVPTGGRREALDRLARRPSRCWNAASTPWKTPP